MPHANAIIWVDQLHLSVACPVLWQLLWWITSYLPSVTDLLHPTSYIGNYGNCICNTCNIVTRNWPINMISVNWGREITENIWNLWIRFKPLVNQIYRVLVVCGMIGMSPPPSHSITFLWSVSQLSGDHSQYSPPSTIFIFHSNSNYSINSSYRQSIPR